MKNKKLLGILGITALLLAGNFAFKEVKEVDAADSVTTEVQALFTKYYNDGVYDKHTVINLNSTSQTELISQFHASVNTLERDTHYEKTALWMSNPSDKYSYYGTLDGNMTSGKVDSIKDTSDSIAVRNTSMEDYYATLHDFMVGKHNSVHSNNEDLNLAAGWTKEGKVYTSTEASVIDGFRLFTAPLWIGKTAENANYIPFSKATVEENKHQLIMKLYVDGTDAEGKLVSGASGVFSQATISIDYECDYSVPRHDSTHHWNECSECGAIDKKTAHNYTSETWNYNIKTTSCVCGQTKEETKLVYKFWSNDWSNSDSAKIYIYYWGDNQAAKWAECTLVDDNGAFGDYYELTLDSNPSAYNKFIIVRNTKASWDGKFNQTGDLLYSDFLATWKKDGKATYYF